MPVVVEACEENQLSYEYRHGVTSYGAFTFALTKTLSQARLKRKTITFAKLVAETDAQLSGTALIATQRVVARKFEEDTGAYPTDADHPLVR